LISFGFIGSVAVIRAHSRSKHVGKSLEERGRDVDANPGGEGPTVSTPLRASSPVGSVCLGRGGKTRGPFAAPDARMSHAKTGKADGKDSEVLISIQK
jgi:hypothetical protein